MVIISGRSCTADVSFDSAFCVNINSNYFNYLKGCDSNENLAETHATSNILK